MARPHWSTYTLREDRKLRTRQALLDAALELLHRDQSLRALSLREVARQAGIVPTAFYRHFRDMEELGLALVDESFRTLRQLLREARVRAIDPEQIIDRSIRIYFEYVRAHSAHFQFILREHFGGVAAVRVAIRNEIRLFMSELATDFARMPGLEQVSTEDLQMIATLIVNAVAAMTELVLDPTAPRDVDEAVVRSTVKQVRLVALGALQWRSK